MNRIFKATISIATLHFITNQRGFDFTMIVSLGKNDNLIGICCHRPQHHSPLASFPLCVGGWGGGEPSRVRGTQIYIAAFGKL